MPLLLPEVVRGIMFDHTGRGKRNRVNKL